jgi:hypothetical protein
MIGINHCLGTGEIYAGENASLIINCQLAPQMSVAGITYGNSANFKTWL